MIGQWKRWVWRPLRRYGTRMALRVWGRVPAQGYWESAESYWRHHPDQAAYQVLMPARGETLDPPSWIGPDTTLPPSFYQREFAVPAAFCYRINQGRVASQYGDVIAPDGRLIYDGWDEPGRRPQECTVCTLPFPPAKLLNQTVGTIASVRGGSNYYHLLVDVLPRLYLLKQSQFWSQIDTIYVNRFVPALQKLQPLLHLVGLEGKKLFWADAYSHIQARAVVATSLTGLPGMSYFKPGWVFTFLRETFLSLAQPPEKTQPRIYISRSRASFRRVLNEPEVLEILRTWGYQPVWLEDLSFAQQVGLFQQAQRIVAPHGAGLTNLVWCQPGARVLEFFPSNYQPICYWTIARQVGVDYGCVVGQGVLTHPDQWQQGIWIVRRHLTQALAWLEADAV